MPPALIAESRRPLSSVEVRERLRYYGFGMITNPVSRRSFLAMAAAAPLASALPQNKRIPVGLELYSVRNELAKDLPGTVTAVAKMGYQVVEFFSPYFTWTPAQAKEVKKLLDDLGIKCNSTHNGANAFTGDGIAKAIELNSTIGSKYIVMASPGRMEPGLDSWKKLAGTIGSAMEKFRAAGLSAGYHNHQTEFKPLEGKRPIEVLAENTPKDFMLQLDVGTCMEMGQDPVAWINANPGRIKSLHLKDWSAGEGKGYQVLFGEGDTPWKKVFDAAESKGGVEFYLIEQEGSRFPPVETAEKCLAAYKKLHG
jgi:sugar phosphate isomerase/epimerase